MQIELNRNQWYVRWFFWSLGIWGAFKDEHECYRVEARGTNLCHFVRVTVFCAPPVLLLHACVYLTALAALTAVPILLFGLTSYVAFVVALVAIISAVWVIKKYPVRKVGTEESSSTARTEPAPEVDHATATPTAPGFFSILWKYIVAGKQMICPTITFHTV